MSGTNESFVQLPPDGSGKAVEAFTVTTPQGQTLYRQSVVIADNATAANSANVDEQGRLQTLPDDKGLLGLIAEDLAQPDGAGPGLLKPPGGVADGSEPSLVVQMSPNSPLVLDPSVPAVIGGIGPDGAARRAKVGTDGGLQLSDAVGQPYVSGASGGAPVCTLDTTGYQSIHLQISGTWAGSVSFVCSNDLQTWANAYGVQTMTPAIYGGAASANGQWILPVQARYVRITGSLTSGTVVIYPLLRTTPAPVWTSADVHSVAGQARIRRADRRGLARRCRIGEPLCDRTHDDRCNSRRQRDASRHCRVGHDHDGRVARSHRGSGNGRRERKRRRSAGDAARAGLPCAVRADADGSRHRILFAPLHPARPGASGRAARADAMGAARGGARAVGIAVKTHLGSVDRHRVHQPRYVGQRRDDHQSDP